MIVQAEPKRVTEVVRAVAARLACAVRAGAGKAEEILDWALDSRWAAAMARSPRWSAVSSAALHGIVILGCLIHWQWSGHAGTTAIPPMVPVDLVTIGDETNITPTARGQLSEPEKDQAITPAASTASPEITPSFEMKLFPPSPPSSESKRPGRQGENSTADASSAPRKDKAADHDIAGFGDETAMTMSLSDALRNQIARCWHPPAGGAGAIVVSFELFLDRGGSISRPPNVVGATPIQAHQQDLHEAEEAVRRAIYTCAPYALPSSRYPEWQNPTLTFDPKMLQGHRVPLQRP
jgi:hypothetical protein